MDIAAWLAITFQVDSATLTLGDASGFATGLACVWLSARASIWNFPWAIVNCLILGLVFLDQKLYADATLQILFIVLSVQGWFQWRTPLGAYAIGFRDTSAG